MSKTVIVLGAKGRFGRAASKAFHNAGWQVRTLARNWSSTQTDPRFKQYQANAFDADAVAKAAEGCDVIVNALNPPYQKWQSALPKLTASVITAALATGATVMLPGNIYNFGADMPQVLTEDTPHAPTTRKGHLREEMEETYAIAADQGVQTIILRSGDFIERMQTGNWFDTYIAAKAAKGRLTYPGPLDCMHAWAYLPDLARAMVALAEVRANLARFASYGFEGYNLTGAELVEAIEQILGHRLQVEAMPWRLMQILGWVARPIAEVQEMQYLWNVPHAIDGAQLRAIIPHFQPTLLDIALGDALGVEPHYSADRPKRLGTVPTTQIIG